MTAQRDIGDGDLTNRGRWLDRPPRASAGGRGPWRSRPLAGSPLRLVLANFLARLSLSRLPRGGAGVRVLYMHTKPDPDYVFGRKSISLVGVMQ